MVVPLSPQPEALKLNWDAIYLGNFLLERTKQHLLLYSEIMDLFMVHQVKIYILSNLLLQILIPCYLDLFVIIECPKR